MPVVDNSNINNNEYRGTQRSISYADALNDHSLEGDSDGDDNNSENGDNGAGIGVSTSQSVEEDDGTGLRFKVPFQEHRMRFDQKFPDGLERRVPATEFEIVLEHVHREFMEALDKYQRSVRNWSVITFGTAPVGVGFFLSPILARRVNRFQKALKTFWISLRHHLKALNRDIYFARGVEWRIEKDLEKVVDRDAYGKLLAFRIEIVFRKPITVNNVREVALRSVSLRSPTIGPSGGNSNLILKREIKNVTDPDLFALLATAPGDYYERELFMNEEPEERNDNTKVTEPDEVVDGSVDGSVDEAIDEAIDVTANEVANVTANVIDDDEPLFLTVEEPAEVTAARVSSTLEPPSPSPEASLFTKTVSVEGADEPPIEKKKMTFADILLEEHGVAGVSVSGVAGVTADHVSSTTADHVSSTEADHVSSTATRSIATTATPIITPIIKDPDISQEEAFAQRQIKKFSRTPSNMSGLYTIPESPPVIGSEDPTGDAMTFLAQKDAEEEAEFMDQLLGSSSSTYISLPRGQLKNFEEMKAPKPVKSLLFEQLDSPSPVGAYPGADPFTVLYETDKFVPIDGVGDDDYRESESGLFTDVDGETEYIRRKKWRVAPESVPKLSRVQTMKGEIIHPSSRRSSFLPEITRTRRVF